MRTATGSPTPASGRRGTGVRGEPGGGLMALRGYRARWIVDGTGGPTHPGVVLIDDERIIDVVGPNSAPSDAEITDLGEAAILPGLIDAHVHLIWAGAKPNP